MQTHAISLGHIGVAVPTPVGQHHPETGCIRFGLIVLEPTSDTEIMGEQNELATAFGGQGVFEWYFADRFGIEGSGGFAIDADVESDDDVVAGVSVIPLTAGFNWHPVRTAKVDWGIGVLGGVVFYSDFEYTDSGSTTTSSVTTDEDFTWGVQTFLDWGFAGSGRWGMSFGVKWLDTDLEANDETLAVDPLIVSVMGKFSF